MSRKTGRVLPAPRPQGAAHLGSLQSVTRHPAGLPAGLAAATRN